MYGKKRAGNRDGYASRLPLPLRARVATAIRPTSRESAPSARHRTGTGRSCTSRSADKKGPVARSLTLRATGLVHHRHLTRKVKHPPFLRNTWHLLRQWMKDLQKIQRNPAGAGRTCRVLTANIQSELALGSTGVHNCRRTAGTPVPPRWAVRFPSANGHQLQLVAVFVESDLFACQ